MKREEWYESADFLKLRLLNNIVAELLHKTQHAYDVLAIIASGKEATGVTVTDKFSLTERQLKIVQLELKKLETYSNEFCRLLEPKKFDDNHIILPDELIAS